MKAYLASVIFAVGLLLAGSASASPVGPAPVGIIPASGPVAGGTMVTISGSNLDAVSAGIGVGGATTSLTLQSANSITFSTPEKNSGDTTDCVLISLYFATDPYVDHSQTFCYVPRVDSVTLNYGPPAGGTSVTVTGEGFNSETAVDFGGVAATSVVVSDDGTSLTAVSPSGTGTVDVTVTTDGGTSATSAADHFTYQLPPSIDHISPTSGYNTPAGDTITITGTGFTGATAVKFGTTAATGFTIVDDTTITATDPIEGTGPVDIRITTPGGTSAIVSGDVFTYLRPPPTVASITPTHGTSGTVVQITGNHFSGASDVLFGGVSVSGQFSTSSDTFMTAHAPDGTGTVDVQVVTGGGTSATLLADRFTYDTSPVPFVASMTPGSGSTAGGDLVTIAGSGFTGATSVAFGAQAATGVTVVSDTSITATSPAGAAGPVDIRVTTPVGTSPIGDGDIFVYVAPLPTVTSLTPNSGPEAGGTQVVIAGTGFTGATKVSFDLAELTSGFTVVSDSEIDVMSPAGTGTVNVTVTTPGGTSAEVLADHFTYVPPPSPPDVSGVSPDEGPTAGGTSVTIAGSGFSGATAVKFGDTAALFVVTDNNTITATSPSGTGTVDVTVTTPGGTSDTGDIDEFIYVAAPDITGPSPDDGPEAGGTTVTITGVNLASATAVKFGTADATITSNTPTSITVTSPAGIGVVDVTVTTAGGTSPAGHTFTYVGTLAVTGLTPDNGAEAGGTTVTISGSGLTGATAVNFGATAATGVSVTDDNTLTATSPAGTGVVDVTVTTGAGTSATGSADHFTYNPAAAQPAVTGLSPDNGAEAGGTTVTISGSGLTGATAVTFGATAATGVSVTDDNTLTATSPAGTGVVDVTVTTGAGTSATGSADHFTYNAPPPPPAAPVVEGLSPDSGPVGGGTPVTIAGQHFLGTTGVTFGGIAATDVHVNGDATLTATSPAAPGPGAVDVVVTNATGPSATVGADQFTYTATAVDSANADLVQNQLTIVEAQTSGAAIDNAIQQGIGVGLSDGSSLDVGPGTLFLAYGPQSTNPADAAAETLGSGGRSATGALSLWLDARGTGLLDGYATDDGWQVNVTGGLGYRVAPNVVVGVLGGYERFDYFSANPAGELYGSGYSVGVYAGGRMGDLMSDISITYSGLSYNVVSGAASGSFDASRLLLSGGLTGMFDLAGFAVEPSARLYALWEGQGDWTDSLGGSHDARSYVTARLSLGGSVSRALPIGDGGSLVPYIGAYADYQDSDDPTGAQITGLGGRLTAGVQLQAGGDARIAVGGELSGLGSAEPAWMLKGTVSSDF